MKEISTDLVSFSGKHCHQNLQDSHDHSKKWNDGKLQSFVNFSSIQAQIVLKKVLHKVTYQHFLTVGISILLDEDNDKRNSYLTLQSFVRSYSNNQMSCYKENNNEIVSILFNLESRHECESWDVTTSAQTEEEEEEESNTHHRVRKRARVLDDFYLEKNIGISQIQQALQRKQNIEKHLREKLKKSKRDLLAIESQNRCLVRENKKLKEAECVKELNKLKKAHSKMKVIKNQQKDSQIAIIKDLTKTNTTLEKRNKELEFIIDNLHTELEDIQQEQTVVTTKSNKKTFSATFRKAAFHCLLHQVPVETTASLIKHIVAELANVTIDFLPNPVQLVSLLTS
ncbi:hypothetical protein GQR58_014964 [Nymphon striatum]|nr:hypothetical protein GQR58_014964 [Nymphon striatum]